jgi:opine dehydrogenase
MRTQLDTVRMAVANALGLETASVDEIVLRWSYGRDERNFTEFVKAEPQYGKVPGPPTMDHRYLTEDVGHLLVFLRDLGKKCGVDVKPAEEVIWATGEALDRDVQVATSAYFGLENASPAEILRALNGAPPA